VGKLAENEEIASEMREKRGRSKKILKKIE